MDIQGLSYIENFISDQEESDLIDLIDHGIWLNELKRRVQHYGYKYDYTKKQIDASLKIEELPHWALKVAHQIYDAGHLPYFPDQLIINEYQPGQGIASHIDCVPCFRECIVSLSLGSLCTMVFTEKKSGKEVETILSSRSLLVMADAARYEWQHGIKAKKSDWMDGVKKARERRISMTFRKVILI